jgi:hypothetical protein
VPLFAALDTLMGVANSNVGWHLLAAAWGHLPAFLGWMKHSCLVASGVPDGNAAWLLECVPEKVAMLILEQVPHMVLGLHTNTPLASLLASLGLDVPKLEAVQTTGVNLCFRARAIQTAGLNSRFG